MEQDWEVPNCPLNSVALIKRLFPFYVHGCKYMQHNTDILHYPDGRKFRALFHENTCSIFIPSCLRIYVVEKGRRIENYFSVACLGPWDSLVLMVSLFSLFPISVSSGHILTSWEDTLWGYLFYLLCMCFFLSYKSGRVGIFL